MIILRRPSRDYVTTVAELCGGRHMIVWRSSCNKNYYVLRTKIATPSQLCNETICKIKTQPKRMEMNEINQRRTVIIFFCMY